MNYPNDLDDQVRRLGPDELFAPREGKILDELQTFAHHQSDDEQKFRRLCLEYINKVIDQSVAEVQTFVQETKTAWQRRLRTVQKELSAQRSLLLKFKEEQRRASEQVVSPAPSRIVLIGYTALYLILLGAAMGIFVKTFPLVFQEQSEQTGVCWSLLLSASSFFASLRYRYLLTDERARLMKRIAWAGFGSSVLFLTAYYLARSFIWSGASSFTAQTLFGSGLGTGLFTFLSTLALLASMVTEICFTSALAIFITSSLVTHKPGGPLADAIAEVEEKVKNLEVEEERLIGAIRGCVDNHALRKWAAAKKTSLHLRLDSMLKRARGDALHRIDTLPTSMLQTMVAGVNNGRINGRRIRR